MSHLDSSIMLLMQEKKLEVQIETSFEEFMKWLQEEKQTFSLDTGNIKLTYNSVSNASDDGESTYEMSGESNGACWSFIAFSCVCLDFGFTRSIILLVVFV